MTNKPIRFPLPKFGLPFLRFRSVKFEISVFYTLILGLILFSFSGVFYIVTSHTLFRELDHELQMKANGIVDNIQTYLDMKGEQPQTLQYAVEKTIAHEGETQHRWWNLGFERSWYQRLDKQDLSQDYVNFTSIDGEFNITTNNLNDEELLKSFYFNIDLNQNKPTYWNLDINGEVIRVMNLPYPREGEPSHILQVGISKGPVFSLLKTWMFAVWVSIPVILLLTGFIGKWLASRILRPIDRITETANNISYENLNSRVEPKLHYKEMNHLISTFNDMLVRLEQSFAHADEFNTHVAHELKTPLTIIRGEAELSLLTAGSDEDKESMRVIIDEIDKMLKTIEDLLFLGKTRYQTESFDFTSVYLNDFLSEMVEQFQFIANPKTITCEFIDVPKKVIVRADQLHLRRLFFNLMDNAIKYTPKDGKVTVSLSVLKDQVQVSVADNGIGISRENVERVFEQFFREENRKKGVGLGLSISQAIAKAHNGEIKVQSRRNQGTIFTVILPLQRISSPALV